MKLRWLSKNSSENVFLALLGELSVRHTKLYSNKYFQEHPQKHNMYGFSKILSEYHIENEGLYVNDKIAVLPELEVPFMAHMGNDFVIVTQNTLKQIEYLWKGKRIILSPDNFIKQWSGAVLLVEPNVMSEEPDYNLHRKQEIIATTKNWLLLLAVILFVSISGYTTKAFHSIALVIALLINFLGLCVSYSLILKQLYIQSSYADRICSLLIRQGDCNNILESKAAKFYGFSWSEIGLSYFMANMLLILFLPSTYYYAAIINVCALPYTCWSLWYQKIKAEQWCPLCLIVQIVLWILFICNLSFNMLQIPIFEMKTISLIGCIYVIPVLLVNIFVSKISDAGKMEEITHEFNSLKADETVFKTLLNTKAKYDVHKSTSSILFGNIDAKHMITIVTNPHCNPCALMHKRLIKLLANTNNGYCIQYVLTSFSEELEKSCKLFIAIYKRQDISSFLAFLDKWYEKGGNNQKEIFGQLFDYQDNILDIELQKHKKWLDSTKIRATPTILFDGYELPENYHLEDLKYFMSIVI
jgi:uncharacterized membrane protein